MQPTREQIEAAALQLPGEERAQLVDALIATLARDPDTWLETLDIATELGPGPIIEPPPANLAHNDTRLERFEDVDPFEVM